MPRAARKEPQASSTPRRSRAAPGTRRTVAVTPSKETRAWLDPQLGDDRRWQGYTHFLNWAASYIREQEGKRKS